MSEKLFWQEKQMREISMTDCIVSYNTETTKKNGFAFLRIKIMLNRQYYGAAQKVQTTREERLVLIVS